MTRSMEATLRLALARDAPALSELMRASVLELFPRYYDARQTASSNARRTLSRHKPPS